MARHREVELERMVQKVVIHLGELMAALRGECDDFDIAEELELAEIVVAEADMLLEKG